MEEEVILNRIIEEANSEANSVIAEAEQKAKNIEEENTKKQAKQAEEQFEIMKQKVLLEYKNLFGKEEI